MIDNKKINKLENFKESYGTLSSEEFERLSFFLSRVFKKNLNIQFKKKFSPGFFDWLYNKNPNGKAITYNVYDNENIIAHFALVPIIVGYKNRLCKSALTVFTAVDEKYRGLSIFYRIGSKIFELAKSMKFEFIIGVANDLSAQLFEKCFKFKLVSPLEVRLSLGGFRQTSDTPQDFRVIWGKEDLSWRLNNPQFNYRIHQNKKHFIIYNNNYKIFKIDMGSFSEEKYYFLKNYKSNLRHNLNPFNIWIGLNNYPPEKSFSINIPKFLKPSALNFIIKNLNSDKIEIKKEDIKFNLIDFEVF